MPFKSKFSKLYKCWATKRWFDDTATKTLNNSLNTPYLPNLNQLSFQPNTLTETFTNHERCNDYKGVNILIFLNSKKVQTDISWDDLIQVGNAFLFSIQLHCAFFLRTYFSRIGSPWTLTFHWPTVPGVSNSVRFQLPLNNTNSLSAGFVS